MDLSTAKPSVYKDAYAHQLEFLRELARAHASFDVMSLNLDILRLEPIVEREKMGFGGSTRLGVEIGRVAVMGAYTDFPAVLGFQISRDMLRWYLLQHVAMPDVVVELGCGAGQNIVAVARAFPAVHFYATDRSLDSIECVKILARAANVTNVTARPLDLLSPDLSFVSECSGFLVSSYGVLAALPDGGAAFFAALAQTRWGEGVFLEPIGWQMSPDALVQIENFAAVGLNDKQWPAIKSFAERHANIDKVLLDFCGHSPLYSHSLIHLSRK